MRTLKEFIEIPRFRFAEEGAAAVEFALILPVMLLMYFGSAEAASLLTVDRKVQSVAGAVGDLVARSKGSLDEVEITDYFRAATNIMSPYGTTRLIQTVTAVEVSDEGETSVLWSVRYSDGELSETVDDYPEGEEYPLPQEMIDIATGQVVIAAEVDYISYTPLLGIVFDVPIDLHRSAMFMPRFGGTIEYL